MIKIFDGIRNLGHLLTKIDIDRQFVLRRLKHEENVFGHVIRLLTKEMDNILDQIKGRRVNDIGARLNKLYRDIEKIKVTLHLNQKDTQKINDVLKKIKYSMDVLSGKEFGSKVIRDNNTDEVYHFFERSVKEPILEILNREEVELDTETKRIKSFSLG